MLDPMVIYDISSLSQYTMPFLVYFDFIPRLESYGLTPLPSSLPDY
jgi:hypothetical protein